GLQTNWAVDRKYRWEKKSEYAKFELLANYLDGSQVGLDVRLNILSQEVNFERLAAEAKGILKSVFVASMYDSTLAAECWCSSQNARFYARKIALSYSAVHDVIEAMTVDAKGEFLVKYAHVNWQIMDARQRCNFVLRLADRVYERLPAFEAWDEASESQ